MLLTGADRIVLPTLPSDDADDDFFACVSCCVRHIAFDDDEGEDPEWPGEDRSTRSELARGELLRVDDSDSLLPSTSAFSLEDSGERDLADISLVAVAADDDDNESL